MTKFRLLIGCMACQFFTFAQAETQWIYGDAAIAVQDAPLDTVRVQAIKNAVANAAYQAGSIVSAEDVTLNGVLVGSSVSLRSNSDINRIEVIDEVLNNGILTVWVRVDIQSHNTCEVNTLGPSVVVSQFSVDDITQTVVGGLQDLGAHLSKRFEQQLQREIPLTKTRILPQAFSHLPEVAWSFTENEKEKTTLLSKTLGYQYVVFAAIRDISLFTRRTESWFSSATQTQRNFTLRLYVLDVFNQTVVLDESYHAEAEWEFGLYANIDLNSSIFWKSAFGRSVLNTISNAIEDTKHALKCRHTLGQVVNVTPDGVVINIGARQGVKASERFTLLRPSAASLTNSQAPVYLISTQSVFDVIQVNPESAILRGNHIGSQNLARLFDLVRKEETPDNRLKGKIFSAHEAMLDKPR